MAPCSKARSTEAISPSCVSRNPSMREPYLNCMICIFMKLGSEAGAYTQLPPLARTMATISSRVEIAYQEEKPVLIPKEHIINSMDKQWLRLRLTSQPIIQLLAGQNIAKNSSLSGSQGLLPSLQPGTKSMTRSHLLQSKKTSQQRHCLMSQFQSPERESIPRSQSRSPSKCKAKPSIASCLARGPGAQISP